MKANETTVQRIIEGINRYVVPLFQRTYSWDNKEWTVLWDDIAELCEEETIAGEKLGILDAGKKATAALRTIIRHFLPTPGSLYRNPEFWKRAYFGLQAADAPVAG